MLGLPQTLWVSPLSIIGGSGPEYFATTLYTIEPGVGTARWQFFAPWSPAAGMVAVLNVILALQESKRGLRAAGIAGWILVALLSQSRLALVALLAILPVLWAMRHAARPWLWLAAVPAMLCAGIFGGALIEWAAQVMDQLQGARADSTRVRAALGRIAVERWQNEAPWFGHGVVEAGPHLVEYMPIGSHHSWYGLLFVKGLTGALALAVPLAVTAAVLGKAALESAAGRCGFGLVLAMVLYSFGENLEMLAYLCWPAWLAIGVALASSSDNGQTKA
ncbi:O-antigen ligase family protein [Altererythrobacter sp. MTPC7]|uniref:O-antigen ligase family protein n=1 Tax=Altererythrobacter sp. MTPC7 TaxID=3056567 RepID=UPI0036F2DD93